ncbi:MAG: type IV pilus assembly protein PilM [Patescibacteria group bacterium]
MAIVPRKKSKLGKSAVWYTEKSFVMANFASNLLSNFFEQKKESVIGIDIGTSAIKVVQLSRKGQKAVLDTYGALSLGPYAGVEIGRATNLGVDKIVEAMNDLLRESGTTTRDCGIAIPFTSSLMATAEVPYVSDAELRGIVPIEARKYIPVPISEVTLDWSVIPPSEANLDETTPSQEEADAKTRPGKKKDILIVAIHNNTIAKYQDIVKKSGLNATFFEIEVFSTMRSVLDQEAVPIMLFDMGAGSTKLYIIERGVVRNSHTINRGSQDITLALSRSLAMPVDRAEITKRDPNLGGNTSNKEVDNAIAVVLDYIFSETSRVILNYQRKFQRNLSKVVLVGGGVGLVGFLEKAKAGFQTDVVNGDPFLKIEAPAFLDDVLKKVGPEFAVAVGIALRRLQEI